MKQRITWPDTAKALGIFLVFWGHLLEKTFPNPLAFEFYKAIYAFHIPMFFMLAGVFYRARNDRFGERVLTLGKSRLGPVFFFCLVAMGFMLLPATSGLSNTGSDLAGVGSLFTSMLSGQPFANWATWFLVCLFTLELIASELFPHLNTQRRQWTALAILLVLSFLLTDNPFKAAEKIGISKGWWFVQEAIAAMPFYLLGHMLAGFWLRPLDSRWREAGIAIACTAGLLLTYDLNMQDPGPPSVNMAGSEHGRPYFFYSTAILGSVALFQWARLIPFNRLIHYIGTNTLPLIGLNGLLLTFFNRPIVDALSAPFSGTGLMIMIWIAAVATLLACLPLVWLLNRWVPLATGRWQGVPAPVWNWLAPRQGNLTVWLALAAAAWTVLCWHQPGTNLHPGLDSSWAYALNYVAMKGLVMGQDVIFTFGPLGFLEHTRPISQQLIYTSTVFWAVLSFILYFNLLRMVQDIWGKASWLDRGIALLAVIVLGVYLDDPVQRLMLLVYVLAMRSHITGKASLLLMASVVASISLMVKFSHGVTTFAFLGIYWVVHAITYKNLRLPLQAAAMAALAYWLIWFAIYHSLSGSVRYILMGLDFSSGSVSAMAQAPEHNSWAILGFYAFYLGGLLTLLVTGGYKRHALLALPFLGPLLIWTRYAFGREDISHLVPLYCFAFHTWLILLPYIQSLLRKAVFAVVMGCTLPVWYYIFSLPVFQFIDMQPESTYHTVNTLKDEFNIGEQIKAWQFKGKKENSVLQLPDNMRQRIGKETVDIYPWQAMISAANTFEWKPRPVFQNYITYTPKLDTLNADFLASTERPQFYVWHRQPFQDIDNRYPFSANPLTLESILRWYKPVMHNKDFHLLEAVTTPQLSAPVTIQQETHSWDSWIPVPKVRADIIKANLSTPKTVAGKLRTSLWKADITFIDYKLDNGRVVTHRLVLDNASNGIWAAPYITDISPIAEGARQIDGAYANQLLGSRQCKGYIENVSTRASTLRLDGWAACLDRNTDQQEILILLHGPEASYLIPATTLTRPGITDHFKLRGQFNLDNSGFSATTAMDSIRPGTYTAHMLTRVGEDVAISDIPHHGITISHGPTQSLNVEAIRLRSSLGWTFKPELQVEWTAAFFLGDRKYF